MPPKRPSAYLAVPRRARKQPGERSTRRSVTGSQLKRSVTRERLEQLDGDLCKAGKLGRQFRE